MQPQGPSISPEHGPVIQPGDEQLPFVGNQPESGVSGTREKITSQGDRVNQSVPAQPVNLPIPQPITPTLSLAPADTSLDNQIVANSPAIADDVDVIEKIWVDKAKAIVNQNKHDPYNQEKEIGKLQADYLKRRYGKIVKVNE